LKKKLEESSITEAAACTPKLPNAIQHCFSGVRKVALAAGCCLKKSSKKQSLRRGMDMEEKTRGARGRGGRKEANYREPLFKMRMLAEEEEEAGEEEARKKHQRSCFERL
jgi:hypothetical protein